MTAWTPQEDQRLVAGRALGYSWPRIVREYLVDRTADSAAARHRYLHAINQQPRPIVANRPEPALKPIAPYVSPEQRACDCLHARTLDLYQRTARERRLSIVTAMQLLQHGPAAAAKWEVMA